MSTTRSFRLNKKGLAALPTTKKAGIRKSSTVRKKSSTVKSAKKAKEVKKKFFNYKKIDRRGLKRTFIHKEMLGEIRPWYNDFDEMKDPLFELDLNKSENERHPGDERRRVFITTEEWDAYRVKQQVNNYPGYERLHPWVGGNGKGGASSNVDDACKNAANAAFKKALAKHAEKAMIFHGVTVPAGGLDYDAEFARLKALDPERY